MGDSIVVKGDLNSNIGSGNTILGRNNSVEGFNNMIGTNSAITLTFKDFKNPFFDSFFNMNGNDN